MQVRNHMEVISKRNVYMNCARYYAKRKKNHLIMFYINILIDKMTISRYIKLHSKFSMNMEIMAS